MQIGLGRAGVRVTQPQSDYRGIHPALEQGHGTAMSQHVGMESLDPKRWASLGRCGGVDRDPALDGITAQPAPCPRGKQRVPQLTRSFVQPDGKHRLGWAGERDGPLLASLSLTADMRAWTQHDVSAVQPDELRYPQARLDSEDEKCAVAAAFPACSIGCFDQRR